MRSAIRKGVLIVMLAVLIYASTCYQNCMCTSRDYYGNCNYWYCWQNCY